MRIHFLCVCINMSWSWSSGGIIFYFSLCIFFYLFIYCMVVRPSGSQCEEARELSAAQRYYTFWVFSCVLWILIEGVFIGFFWSSIWCTKPQCIQRCWMQSLLYTGVTDVLSGNFVSVAVPGWWHKRWLCLFLYWTTSAELEVFLPLWVTFSWQAAWLQSCRLK